MTKAVRFGLGWSSTMGLAALMSACSGAPSSEQTQGGPGSGPIDGEIPGAGGTTTGGGTPMFPSGDEGASSAAGTGFGGTAGSGGATGTAGTTGTGGTGSGGVGGSAGTGGTGGTGGSGAEPSIEPGTLTAGAWDDNRNFDRFLGYRTEVQALQPAGLLGLSVDEHQASHDASAGWLARHDFLDVALVIDTTGSMGDEIEYLKAELIAISGTIASLHPSAEQRWSLIVYRDIGDEYVVRWFGFRSGVLQIQQYLTEQSAGGGGDYEEAPNAAFATLNQLYWRPEDNVARLAFWVADAPHHADNAGAFTDALRRTRNLGIHVYPVASSGVDELTELTMRSAAQVTGGRYLFLTDDSGVGGVHKEPSIPCYFVTQLDAAMVRMVDIEMSGIYREPAPEEILRTGGDPQDGACVLESGAEVTVF